MYLSSIRSLTFGRMLFAAVLISSAARCLTAAAQTPAPVGAASEVLAQQADEQAQDMLRRGVRLLESGETERGINLLAAVPLNFPQSRVRYEAFLALGRHYIEENEFQLAIRNLTQVTEAEESALREEAYFRIGVAWYGMGDFGRAFSALRRVVDDFPWSRFANEAHYYIGLSHFRLSNWSRAVDAFRMVGTTVPPNTEEINLVESGDRFYIKVQDKDLRVLERSGGVLDVRLRTRHGDAEVVRLERFDPEGEHYFGSIEMTLGAALANDDILQVKGGDEISVEYLDVQTGDGRRDLVRTARSRVVSTARVGFMDGAYREYVHGVFDQQKTFLQVKDYDASVSAQPDTLIVTVSSRFMPRPEGLSEDETEIFVDPDAEEEIRATATVTLRETGPHTGYFTGEIIVADVNTAVAGAAPALAAVDGDDIVIEYVDAVHVEGLEDPLTRSARARFLVGQIQDVRIVHREVDTEVLRARKNLLEARTYLRLAEIFKSVGLRGRAADNANIGLERVDDIIRRSLRVSLDQDLVEGAYRVKWELLMAKGDLQNAIRVCRELMALFPSSSLVDVAFMQIAKAELSNDRSKEALPILNGLLSMRSDPELKAEAQFLIAGIHEKGKNRAAAIEAYRKVAGDYPRSPFAGEALNKVIDFHIEERDFPRCVEMLETVFMDYPDADFLDSMLLKWGVVLARMQRNAEAVEKLDQLVYSYPQSPFAERGRQMAQMLRQRIR